MAVQAWRAELEKRGARAVLIDVGSALRKLASEAADNGLLAPEVAAGIAKVRGAPERGCRGRELAVAGTGPTPAAANDKRSKASAIERCSRYYSAADCAERNSPG